MNNIDPKYYDQSLFYYVCICNLIKNGVIEPLDDDKRWLLANEISDNPHSPTMYLQEHIHDFLELIKE